MTEETKVVLSIAGAMVLGLLFFCAADVGKTRARHDYYAGYAAAVDSVLIEHMQRGALDMVRAGGLPFDLTVYNARRDSVVCVVRVGGAR